MGRFVVALALALLLADVADARSPGDPPRRDTPHPALDVAAAAQSTRARQAARSAPRSPGQPAEIQLLTFGGFLGQFDGFCEPPGGPHDLALAEPTQVCWPGGPGGNEPTGPHPPSRWPAALGGLLGAKAWVERMRPAAGPDRTTEVPPTLLLVQGNNQTPDFADSGAGARTAPPVGVPGAAAFRSKQAARQGTEFWPLLKSLNPTAVALGPEDFYRSLRESSAVAQSRVADGSDTPARRFADWVTQELAGGLPLLASNVVLSASGKGVNTVATADGRYALDVPADASIGWEKALTVRHPCGAVPGFVLEISVAPDATDRWETMPVTQTTEPPSADGCGTKLTMNTGMLRPGARFRVSRVVSAAPRQTEVIAAFRTTAALTPMQSGPRELAGWPLLLQPMRTTRDVRDQAAPADADEILIVSLVSAGTRSELGHSQWTWTARATRGSQHACAAASGETTCRIDFLPPVEAMSAILEKVLATRQRLPLVVLLSSLDDEETLEVLDEFPEIRIAILAPDSRLLGRAARETPRTADDSLAARLAPHAAPPPGGERPAATPAQARSVPAFSGDLGMLAVLDAHEPGATRVVARPEWVGETGTRVVARVAFERGAGDLPQWTLDVLDETTVATIPGVPLEALPARATPDGRAFVAYQPLGHPELKSEEYVAYLPCGPRDRRPICAAFRDVWTQAPILLAVAGDALRERSGADVVVVPDSLVDPDAVAWLQGALSGAGTGWLSRFMLQRTAYRSYRFVRADVAGDELLPLLQRILEDPLATGTKYCISGLGPLIGCPSTLRAGDLERVRVNGRVIRPGLFYTVALPDRLAEHEGLPHSDRGDDGLDVVDALDGHLSPGPEGKWYPPAWTDAETGAGLIARLEARAARRLQHFINLTDVELGWSGLDANAPGGGESIPNNVDIDSSGAQSRTARMVALKSEAAIFDGKRQALRAFLELDYATRREPGNQIVSYDRDRVLTGARIDVWKVRTLGDLRPFAGFFWEGPVRTHVIGLQAARELGRRTEGGDTFVSRETTDFTTPFQVRRNVYRYVTAGADLLVNAATLRLPATKLSLKRGKLEWNTGSASRVPIDLVVDDPARAGDERVLADIQARCPSPGNEQIRTGDAAQLLNAYFSCTPDALSQGSTVMVLGERRGQTRTQLELEGAVAFTGKGRTYTLNLLHRQSYYTVKGAPTDLAVRRAWRFQAQLTVPLWWRFELAPTYEYQRAFIFAADRNRFSVHRWDLRLKAPLFIGLGRRALVE